MLWMYQRVFLGEVRPENQNMPDLDRLEKGILLPAVVLMLLLGVCSPFFLRKMDASTLSILDRVGGSEIHVQDDSPENQQRQAARLMAPRNPDSFPLPKDERSGETVSGIAY